MELLRFNDKGVASFREFLAALRDDPTIAVPTGLLSKSSLVERLPEPIQAEPRRFKNRMAFAQWLHAAAAGTRVPLQDAGFWSWLTLLLFDQVCPEKNGERAIKEEVRYIPQLSNARRYYRHALVGPYLILDQHKSDQDQATALLCGALDRPNDEAYRLFIENGLMVHHCAVSVLTDLYYDPVKNRLRRGSQTKSAGAIRRFVKVLHQYSRTYDLDVLSSSRLKNMLPAEFNPWRTVE